VSCAIAARHGKTEETAKLGKDRSGLLDGDKDAVRDATRGMAAGRDIDLHSGIGLDRPVMIS